MTPETGATVTSERMGPVVVLALSPGPCGLLDGPLRRALWQALDAAEDDPDARAVMLIAGGAAFPSGDELARLAVPSPGRSESPVSGGPALSALCDRVERGRLPVVVALHGLVSGGGVDLALACHARVARADARLALPQRRAGLVPGGGATQRLPRLIGPEQALRIMLDGLPVGAAEALALGMIDAVAEGDGLAAQAWRMAESLAAAPCRSRDRTDHMRDAKGWFAAVNQARQAGAVQDAAGTRILACVEMAMVLPFDQGLVCEAEALADLEALPRAPGLAHALMLEQAAESAAGAPPDRVGVMGARLADVALALLEAGLAVVLVDPQRPRLVKALERIAALQEQSVTAGSLTPAQREADWDRLTPALGAAALADCAAVLISHPEQAAEAEQVVGPVPLVLAGPGLVDDFPAYVQPAALRFGVGRLAEVVSGPGTAPASVAAARALAVAVGFLPVGLPEPGGIATRLAEAGRAAVVWLLLHDTTPYLAEALAARGFAALLPEGLALQGGHTLPRAQGAFLRVAAAMANAGARMLDQGQAPDAATIDLAALAAGIFPRSEGGPMFWADRRGALILRHDLALWSVADARIWTIAPLLARLAEHGGRLADHARTIPATTSIRPSAEIPSAPMLSSTTF